MHQRYAPLQNWERAALNEYARQHKEGLSAYLSACFLLALRLRDARALLTPAPSHHTPHHTIVYTASASAIANLETRLYALFAE